jgi:hypothetical protein
LRRERHTIHLTIGTQGLRRQRSGGQIGQTRHIFRCQGHQIIGPCHRFECAISADHHQIGAGFARKCGGQNSGIAGGLERFEFYRDPGIGRLKGRDDIFIDSAIFLTPAPECQVLGCDGGRDCGTGQQQGGFGDGF